MRVVIDKRAQRMLYRQSTRRNIREYILHHKLSHPCRMCGESKVRLLTFHHLNPSTKLFDIGKWNCLKVSLTKVKAEIAKCEVLCEKCHIEIHSKSTTMTGWSEDFGDEPAVEEMIYR